MTASVWEVERIDGPQGGRTKPLIVASVLRGAAGEPMERRDMLTKAIGLPETTEKSLFAEYFGARLAVEFGIDAPLTFIVDLSSELLAASSEQLKEWGVAPKPGQAVTYSRTGFAGVWHESSPLHIRRHPLYP